MTETDLPRPAIRPYPTQYVLPWKMTSGDDVTIRPIRPEDEPLMVELHNTLSERSVRLRYFAPMKLSQRVTHERLLRVCFNDYDRELALVADRRDPTTGKHEVLGVGRMSKLPGTQEAEFAILVSDLWQNRGLGTQFLKQIVQIARDEKLVKVSADILPENLEMQKICTRLGFKLIRNMEDSGVRAEILL